MKTIASASNPFVKRLRALAGSAKARREAGCFLVEGRRAVESALKTGRLEVETLVTSEAFPDELDAPEDIERVSVPERLFDRFSGVRNAQGVLAVVRMPEDPLEFDSSRGRYLLLDELRDPGNLGTLVRSAVGAGFDAVLLCGDCVDPYNPKAVRATMGTIAAARIHSVDLADVDRMKAAGYALCIATGDAEETLYETPFGERLVLAVGSEAHGVRPALRERADRSFRIPLRPACESLNAAIAGSVCLFQIACARPAPTPE